MGKYGGTALAGECADTAQGIAMHTQAAEQLEQALLHHREAIGFYELGNLKAARFHAYAAHARSIFITSRINPVLSCAASS
jgi:hypothetical protein